MTLGPLHGRTVPRPAVGSGAAPATVVTPAAPAPAAGGAAPSDAFSTTTATPEVPAPKDLSFRERAGNALNAYISNRTNVTTGAISAGRAGVQGVGMLLRGMPVVGNVVNAASALLSAARAAVTTVARVKGRDGVETADVVADWARVATDIGGIFFPPVGVAGAAGDLAYRAYDFVEDHNLGPGSDHKPA